MIWLFPYIQYFGKQLSHSFVFRIQEHKINMLSSLLWRGFVYSYILLNIPLLKHKTLEICSLKWPYIPMIPCNNTDTISKHIHFTKLFKRNSICHLSTQCRISQSQSWWGKMNPTLWTSNWDRDQAYNIIIFVLLVQTPTGVRYVSWNHDENCQFISCWNYLHVIIIKI